jgi:hypothetical protein
MSCFSEDVQKVFEQWKHDDYRNELDDFHSELVKRRIAYVEYGDLATLTEKNRCKLNCQVIRQALLHRAESLLLTSGTMLLEKNVYGLALVVRGHIECTAVLGYFCNRTQSYQLGNIDLERIKWDVADAVLGAKHELFSKANAPPNITTCIEKADKYLDKMFEKKSGMLTDCYSWLSEYAHPNFLSNSSAFRLDKATGRMVFRHEHELRERDFQLIVYLTISAGLFTKLFDTFGELSECAFSE